MSVTQTLSTSSQVFSSTPLGSQPSPSTHEPPVQLFRALNSSEVTPIETVWSEQLRRNVIHSQTIEDCFERKILKVTREDGTFISVAYADVVIDGRNCMERVTPYCYQERKGSTLIVHFKDNTLNPTEPSPGIVNNVDLLIDQIRDSSGTGNWALVNRLVKEVECRLTELMAEQHESAQVLSIKCLQLQLYPVPHTTIDEAVRGINVHIASHGGYRISDPKPFCNDYGAYILTVLRCLQVGLMVAGVVIPGLAAANITGLFTTLQSAFNYNNPSFADPYLKTMQYVIDQFDSGVLSPLEMSSKDLDIPEPLEGLAYSKFQQYLRVVDKEGANGNLAITFCHRTGRLKWVCKDHVEPSVHGKSLLDHLEAVVKDVATAQLDRTMGSLTLGLPADKRPVSKLYDALEAAPGVKMATIVFGSLTSQSDFDSMVRSIGIANVPSVVLDGSRLKKDWGLWYKRVLTIMTNSRCRAVRLFGFQGFFDHDEGVQIDKVHVHINRSNQLMTLHLDINIDFSRHMNRLTVLLQLFPGLKYLSINTAYSTATLQRIQSVLPRLQLLTMTSSFFTAVVTFTADDDDRATHTVELLTTGNNISNLHGHLRGTILDHLASLNLDCSDNPKCPLGRWLTGLATVCPQLRIFNIRIPLERFSSVIGDFHSLAIEERAVRLRSLSADHKVDMVIIYKKTELPAHTMLTKIEMTGPQDGNAPLREILECYGQSVESLTANDLFDDELLRALLSSTNSGTTSALKQLSIDPAGLTALTPLRVLLDTLPDLEFTLSLSNLQNEAERLRALACALEYGSNVDELMLHGQGDFLKETMAIGLSGKNFPKLRGLEIKFKDRTGIKAPVFSAIQDLISSRGTTATPLKSFFLSNCDLSRARWGYLLDILDFTILQRLSVEDTNFESAQMQALIGKLRKLSIPSLASGNGTMAPLNELFIQGTDLAKTENRASLDYLETQLLKKVPGIRVMIS